MDPKKVVKHYGDVKKTANAIGMTTDAVYRWLRQGYIPYPSQVIIQLHSEGKFKANK